MAAVARVHARAWPGSASRRCSAAALLPLVASGYMLGLLTVAYYTAVFAMAWDLLFGFAGEVNFGPTFLIGLGAYTAGILDARLSPGDLDLALRRRGRRRRGRRAACSWRCPRCACAAPTSA